ncbi:MAG: acetylserotonin O-methyltransferase [Tabrizicola sp.]|jgi:demethylspheroidene O-methyltransferase|nr:acetylserotonin O-methyltransferase [Tabrizicola sp.]
MNAEPRPPPARPEAQGWLTRLAMSPRFHRLAARIPGLRGIARREGAELFQVISGFVQSQALVALVEARVLQVLAAGPRTTDDLSRQVAIQPAPLTVLMRAGAALRLVRLDRSGKWALAPRGAAFLTVPGLEPMVRHHHVLYRDLTDPLAFFRGQTETELAGFWPYVFGPLAQADAGLAARYSRLMAESQVLVAEDTLRLVDLSRRRHLLDVGGGTGAFLGQVAKAHPGLTLSLVDMPAVLQTVPPSLRDRLRLCPGDFRADPFPTDADTISLIRVLYDHGDATVAALLTKVHAALPSGGMIVVSEPMSGGLRPDPATDVYFAIYTLAMRTGRTRSAVEIGAQLQANGFADVRLRPGDRPYVTSAVTAVRT